MSAAVRGAVAVVPAAGASRRFGGMKLLADLRGEPLLQYTLRSLLDASITRVVVAVAPDHELARVPLMRDARTTIVVNPDPDRGMFSSIQAALTACVDASPIVILPADMPFVMSATIRALVADHARDDAPVVAAHHARRGHPIVLPGHTRAGLLDQAPATTLKQAMVELGLVLREVAVDDPGVLRDVDVPADLTQP